MAKPWQTHEEYLTDQALEAALSLTPDEIRELRPQHPLELFPQNRGFVKQTATVMDILTTNRYTATNRSWLSGMPVRRTQLADGDWTGTGRYSMDSLG